MAQKVPPGDGTPTPPDAKSVDAWLNSPDRRPAAEDVADRRVRRACARMTLQYMRTSFQRLERETLAHGRRAEAAATAGVIACVVLPLVLGVTAVVLSLAGVARPFGLSEAGQKVLGMVLPAVPVVYFGLYRSVCTYLVARHRELREEAAACLSHASLLQERAPRNSRG